MLNDAPTERDNEDVPFGNSVPGSRDGREHPDDDLCIQELKSSDVPEDESALVRPNAVEEPSSDTEAVDSAGEDGDDEDTASESEDHITRRLSRLHCDDSASTADGRLGRRAKRHHPTADSRSLKRSHSEGPSTHACLETDAYDADNMVTPPAKRRRSRSVGSAVNGASHTKGGVARVQPDSRGESDHAQAMDID